MNTTDNQASPGAAPAVLPVVSLKVADIVPDPKNQTRNDPERLAGLCESIRVDGLLQPITVRRLAPLGVVFMNGTDDTCFDVLGGVVGDVCMLYSGRNRSEAERVAGVYRRGGFMIVAGERRWCAHRMLQRPEIEARVIEDKAQLALVRKRAVENLERENLNPIQEARQYQELIDSGMSQVEAAAMARVDESTMSNRLRILKLPGWVQRKIEAGELTRAHGLALLRFEEWPELLLAIAAIAVELGVTSKRLEKGLPFARHPEVARMVVEVWHLQLPAEWKRDPAVFEADPLDDVAAGNVYVVDVKRWKASEAKRMVDRAKQEDAERAERGKDPKAKASAAAAAEAAAKDRERIRALREETITQLARAQAAIRVNRVPRGYLMAKLAAAALSNCSQGRLEQAFASQGVRQPACLFMGGRMRSDVGKLRSVSPDGLLRVAVAALLGVDAEKAIREAGKMPDTIAGMAAMAPSGKKAGRNTEKPKAVAKAKAIPRGKKREKPMKITDEIRQQVKVLTEAGRTLGEISKVLCISVAAAHTIRKSFGLVKPRVPEAPPAAAAAGKEAA